MNDVISPPRNKRVVLVTGAGGFIGANLVRRLLTDGYRVHVIWRKETNPWRITDILSQLSLHEVELSDRSGLTTLVEHINPKTVFHLAAHGAYSSQTDIDRMIEVNIKGTLNLLAASKNVDYDMFVNTGSSSEYGFKNKPMKETDVLEPTSFYAATKASATHLCRVFSREYNKPVVTLRPFSVFGPYEEPSRFIPTIIKALIAKTPIRLTPGVQRRDFVYIDDVIDAYFAIMKKGKSIKGELFNIGSGIEQSNDEVVQKLFSATEKKTRIVKGAFPARSWDTEHWVADISRANRLLGWQPRYTLTSGLKKTFEWFTQHQKDAGFTAHKHPYDIK